MVGGGQAEEDAWHDVRRGRARGGAPGGAVGRGMVRRSSKGAELDAEEALKLQQRISSGKEVSTSEVLRVIGAGDVCSNIYDRNCKCKKDSPNCLCGLLPIPGSFRRKGLWQKDVDAFLSLGTDPSLQQRKVSIPWSTMHCAQEKQHEGFCA